MILIKFYALAKTQTATLEFKTAVFSGARVVRCSLAFPTVFVEALPANREACNAI